MSGNTVIVYYCTAPLGYVRPHKATVLSPAALVSSRGSVFSIQAVRLAVCCARCGVCRGYWVLPTIFVDVTDDMKISQEEIFGPVVCVSKFDTIEEAVKI